MGRAGAAARLADAAAADGSAATDPVARVTLATGSSEIRARFVLRKLAGGGATREAGLSPLVLRNGAAGSARTQHAPITSRLVTEHEPWAYIGETGSSTRLPGRPGRWRAQQGESTRGPRQLAALTRMYGIPTVSV